MNANAQQVIDWNGDSGACWVAHQEQLDRMLEPYGLAALTKAAIRSGDHVLDIGCGAGESTLAIAGETGPSGRALGIDISEPLIRRACERVRDTMPQAEFRIADASTMTLPVAGFDCLFSRFGVMFFDDPVAAFAHMRSGLKPGGRLAFACWRGAGENDWATLPLRAIEGIVPSAPAASPTAPGPFSFGDPDRVRDILRDAGFDAVEIEPIDHSVVFGEGATGAEAVDDALDRAFAVGPLRRALAGQADLVVVKAAAAVHAAFTRKLVDNRVLIDGAGWIVSARNRAH
ncbi:class I SAM-dependent methyltransferase [Sphingomonas montanisoli]|uniref:Methyltransferase domain-containing protein n=1 Tax=Sphingomonas montanisoli TaxID=2606412 RepID=A0A5D9C9R5_9SPHN|nr:class I SAM-dependent methyltransferase [Sphingomonas montanisoli]TZG27790.1 methyltransferase domain-containing protein [Sphingomonas montanisoli]